MVTRVKAYYFTYLNVTKFSSFWFWEGVTQGYAVRTTHLKRTIEKTSFFLSFLLAMCVNIGQWEWWCRLSIYTFLIVHNACKQTYTTFLSVKITSNLFSTYIMIIGGSHIKSPYQHIRVYHA